MGVLRVDSNYLREGFEKCVEGWSALLLVLIDERPQSRIGFLYEARVFVVKI
jgi:hypothetical protein